MSLGAGRRFDISGQKMPARYSGYMRSRAWWEKREEKLQAVGKRCERCRSGEGLAVHHKTYERVGNERLEDLEVLCDLCHFKEHNSIQSLVGSFFRKAGTGRGGADPRSEKEIARRESLAAHGPRVPETHRPETGETMTGESGGGA